MIYYETREGDLLKGDTSKDIVYKMMKQDFVVTTKSDYLKEVRERIEELDNVSIDISSFDSFLGDLERLGYITKYVYEEHDT